MPKGWRRCYFLNVWIVSCASAAQLLTSTAVGQTSSYVPPPPPDAAWQAPWGLDTPDSGGVTYAVGATPQSPYVSHAVLPSGPSTQTVPAAHFAAAAGNAGPQASCGCINSWYLSVSGGWQNREIVHEANDPLTFIIFRNGFAANAAVGFRFDPFRFEAEYSFMNNDVDIAGAAGLSSPAAGNVNLRAFMFNVYHDVQLDLFCWSPYVGAGIGIYQSEINSLYPDFFNVAGAPFAGTAVNTTSDMPLAYQFRIGATRPVGERTEFFVGYRYFRGEELEFAAPPFSNFAPTFHPDGAKVHSIEMGLRVNF